ncbi:hypothetical protein [Geminisphaera colitermitum]|uniref:hypothetical protein n=1 Tax=Geminisphaera colitermitum TaxID=1148786 RepID=UPI000158D477|nr:hypothetical protein [Geminisphaera colitermitum]
MKSIRRLIHHLTMSVLLTLPLILISGNLANAQPAPLPPVKNPPALSFEAKAWNDIQIRDDTGKTLFTIGAFTLKSKPSARTTDGKIRKFTTDDGQPALEITYTLTATGAAKKDDTPLPTLTGLLQQKSGYVDITWTLTKVPADASIGMSVFERTLAPELVRLAPAQAGVWKRHPKGGQPQEHLDGRVARYRLGERILSIAFDPAASTTLGRDTEPSERTQHIRPLPETKDSTTHIARCAIILSPADHVAELVTARWHGRPAAIKTGTPNLYNWWESVPGAPADKQPELTLNADIANTSDATRTYVLKYWIRDFAGAYVSRSTREITLSAGQLSSERIRFRPAAESPDPTRDIFFAEVSLSDKTTGAELAFARTHLALLPPYEFKGTSADSLFGLSAYWPIPDEASAQRVMERMGVRWYRLSGREGKNPGYKHITPIRHTHLPKGGYVTDIAKNDEWIRSVLQNCVDNGYPVWEPGNEMNYGTTTIGMGDVLKQQARERRVAGYMKWLEAIRRVQKEMGPPATNIKILSFGLAGMDVNFTNAIHAAGGWQYLDGLALHPGRGNYAADYPISDWDTWQTGAYGNYWNYYGSVRTAAQLMKKYGEAGKPKELWLTEVYALTFPNHYWSDTMRRSAENTLLSLALAMAENVKAVMWYQLFDTTHADKLGINPKDREYYFGLIQRDLSFKPSLLAYAAAAEELDQAKFVRWIHFPKNAAGDESKSRGLLFTTPRGPLVILWDRTDGYVLTDAVGKDYISPEPWIDEWRSQIPVTLPVASGQKTVTTINSIGQRRTYPVSNTGTNAVIEQKLTGAPLLIYGLDPARLP